MTAVVKDVSVEGQRESSSVDVDVSGFDDFFHANHVKIVRALALALGDEHLARDAASEGFAKALQRWSRVNRYDNPAGWVYRAGLNWGRSRWRKTRREVSVHGVEHREPLSAEPQPIDPRLTPALRGLSIDHRVVVVARYYLDWSEQQIADALGIRPGTVKSRLSRALDALSSALGPA